MFMLAKPLLPNYFLFYYICISLLFSPHDLTTLLQVFPLVSNIIFLRYKLGYFLLALYQHLVIYRIKQFSSHKIPIWLVVHPLSLNSKYQLFRTVLNYTDINTLASKIIIRDRTLFKWIHLITVTHSQFPGCKSLHFPCHSRRVITFKVLVISIVKPVLSKL